MAIIRRALFLAVFCALFAGGVRMQAQQGEVKPMPVDIPQKKADPSTVYGRADYTKTVWSGSDKTVLMRGNVRFTHEGTTFTSDMVEYSEQDKKAVSPGKVKIVSDEAEVVGDAGSLYLNKRLGIVTGNVVMTLKPKDEKTPAKPDDSARGKLKQPTTISCKRLEYKYKSKISVAAGGVVFVQKNRTASANEAVFDQKNEIVTLKGNVSGVDEYNQTFSAPGVVKISIKEGDEWMEAPNASASFKIDVDEE